MFRNLFLFFFFITLQTSVAQTISKDCNLAQPLTQTVDYCSAADQYNNLNANRYTWFQFTATALDVSINVSGAGAGGTLTAPTIKLYSDCSGTQLVGTGFSANQ